MTHPSTTRHIATCTILGCLVYCTIALPARGQDSNAVSAEQLARCAAIEAAQQRLGCYDKLAGRSTEATTLAMSPQQAFGLSIAQRDRSDTLETLAARVARIGRAKFTRPIVELENGQIWELDTDDVRLEVGETVTIRRGALRSFLLSTPQRKVFRAKRLR